MQASAVAASQVLVPLAAARSAFTPTLFALEARGRGQNDDHGNRRNPVTRELLIASCSQQETSSAEAGYVVLCRSMSFYATRFFLIPN